MLATVPSLTSANRMKRRLYESGVYASVLQTPQSIAKDGCGYSLRIDDYSKPIVESVAEELGIKIRSFYTESTVDGKKAYSKI